jgi:hypothetical protein
MEAPKRISPFTRFTGHLLLLLCLLAGTARMGRAQSTATLEGTVSDPNGNAVPGAKVLARNVGTGVETQTVADNAGQYLFPSLPIGLYRVEVSQQGFETVAFTDLKLDVATIVTRNVELKLGTTTTTVEVQGGLPVVDVTTSGMGEVINDKTVQDIPLNGRHFTDLSLLTPGTMTPPANGFLSFPLRGQGSFGINTAGQREDTTN